MTLQFMKLWRSLLHTVLVTASPVIYSFCIANILPLISYSSVEINQDAWSQKMRVVSVSIYFLIRSWTLLNQNNNLKSITIRTTGKLSGIISERDYVKKVALLQQTSKEMKVKEISTGVENLVVARPEDTVDACMQKMLGSDIRHLPLVDELGEVVGIVSIKDLIKSVLEEKEHTIESLASFAVGEGGHFVM